MNAAIDYNKEEQTIVQVKKILAHSSRSNTFQSEKVQKQLSDVLKNVDLKLFVRRLDSNGLKAWETVTEEDFNAPNSVFHRVNIFYDMIGVKQGIWCFPIALLDQEIELYGHKFRVIKKHQGNNCYLEKVEAEKNKIAKMVEIEPGAGAKDEEGNNFVLIAGIPNSDRKVLEKTIESFIGNARFGIHYQAYFYHPIKRGWELDPTNFSLYIEEAEEDLTRDVETFWKLFQFLKEVE